MKPDLIPELEALVEELSDDGGSDAVMAADLLETAIPILKIALDDGMDGDQWWALVRQTLERVQATVAAIQEYLMTERVDGCFEEDSE